MSQHVDFQNGQPSNGQHSIQFNFSVKDDDGYEKEELGVPQDQSVVPSVCGMPLKYVS